MGDKNTNDPIFCSFCGKNRKEVAALVAGPMVYLCSECWELATNEFAKRADCDPTVAYAVIKKQRLDQQELYLRRQVALVRTNEVVEIRGAQEPGEDDEPEPEDGGNVQDGGTST